jgi:hypothetical protein
MQPAQSSARCGTSRVDATRGSAVQKPTVVAADSARNCMQMRGWFQDRTNCAFELKMPLLVVAVIVRSPCTARLPQAKL